MHQTTFRFKPVFVAWVFFYHLWTTYQFMNAVVASGTAETLWTFHILLTMPWRCRNHPTWQTKIGFSLRRYFFYGDIFYFERFLTWFLFSVYWSEGDVFYLPKRDVSKVIIYIYLFLWILNFLFHLKLKEVTTEALKGAESTRKNLRRLEESSDF